MAALEQVMLAFVAVLARLAPAIWLVPFLAGRLVPASFRVAAAVALAVVLFPLVAADTRLLASEGVVVLVGLLVKEVFVGLAIGLFGSLVFWAAQAAGHLIDTASGTAMGETSAPLTGGQTTAQGHLLLLFTVVIFLSLGGHRLFVLALARSYELVPLGGLPSESGVQGVALLAIRLTGELIVVAVTLAAPVIVTLLLVDITLGWLNRFAPQMNAYFLALPLKGLLGVGVMVLVVAGLVGLLPELLALGINQVERALGLLGQQS
jgi:flagellar biosynthetic protein FliR